MSKGVRAGIVGSFVVLTAVAGVLLATAGSNPIQVGCRDLASDDPLGNGVKLPPEEAVLVFTRPMVRPQNQIASDETIAELWVRTGPAEVYIVYRSGIIVNLSTVTRPTWMFARDFTADGSPGELVKVRGIDVFTVPPQRPCFGGNAVFNVGRTHVAVINDGTLPFAVVRAVTESIIDTSAPVIASHVEASAD